MPAAMACTGTVAGQNNVCLVRAMNAARAGVCVIMRCLTPFCLTNFLSLSLSVAVLLFSKPAPLETQLLLLSVILCMMMTTRRMTRRMMSKSCLFSTDLELSMMRGETVNFDLMTAKETIVDMQIDGILSYPLK
jgi:hypothetical protein